MNKAEVTIVALLVLVFVAWSYRQRIEQAQQPVPVATEAPVTAPGGDGEVPAVEAEAPVLPVVAALPPAAVEPVQHSQAEVRVVLTNENTEVIVTSWGGGISQVQLEDYRESLEPDSGPVVLAFSNQPALAIRGLPGIGVGSDMTLQGGPDGRSAMLSGMTQDGLAFTRSLSLDEAHRMQVIDTFSNVTAVPIQMPYYYVAMGSMRSIESGVPGRMDASYTGIDTLDTARGAKVVHWAAKGPPDDRDNLVSRFVEAPYRGGCQMTRRRLAAPLPRQTNVSYMSDTLWAAVKNKFFVQILYPSEPGRGVNVELTRAVSERENPADPRTWESQASLDTVNAELCFNGRVLAPGEGMTRAFTYYVGPKKYDLVSTVGPRSEEVMEFGFWSPISRVLLSIMVWIHSVIPNYGVAIILLTMLIKFVFWPVTHRSTEQMRKMQMLQPQIKALQEKYKDNLQKFQREQQALYREHKVNPMAGCLPMLIQIPVFFAFFTMLRSAVELRYADFLWIQDLSEPERLLQFGFALPLIGWDSLNILPLIMTGTTILQQKLTPQSGDPQQQKMMMLMPVMMLLFFYNMASGLLLYWTTNTVFTIIGLLVKRYLEQRKQAA